MAERSYEFRLEGLSSPSGEIALRDLAGIGQALQLTATRIARQLAGQVGAGRSRSAFERISELRLAGIGAGSTVLEVRLGEADALELPGGDEEAVADRFEELFSAIAANHRPEWAEAPVIEAVGRFAATVAACGATALTASRRRNDTLVPWQVIDVASVDDTVWKVKATLATEHTAIAGWLDKVDLRARKFRIRDDVGNDVTLEDVVDVGAAAQLIGQRVVARGAAERERGKVVRIVEPSLEAEELPASWASQPTVGLLHGGALPGGGIPGVTRIEVDEFLAEIRG